MLGLPDHIQALLFDLDGVLTPTAELHTTAWKRLFDDVLREGAERLGVPFVAFDADVDYLKYVDGKPRTDGTRSFLSSRGIELPEGEPGDPPELSTVHGLSARKDGYFTALLRSGGIRPYPGSVRYLDAVRAAGLHCAVVSSSRNCAEVLRSAGLESYVDVRIDGVFANREGLPGKPRPDTFLAAARHFGVDPTAAAVFEDALSGVEAGRDGGFGIVVGVDRTGHPDQLRSHGADVVVSDLAELLDGAATAG
jgi:beta-phosphoglucomutase family hydrolase